MADGPQTRHFVGMRSPIGLLFFILILTAAHYYIWCRLIRDVRLPRAMHRAFTVLLVALGAGMPSAMILRRMHMAMPPAIMWAALIWSGVFFLTFIGLLLADATRAVGTRLAGNRFDLDRRLVLSRLVGGTAATFGLGASGVAMHEALSGPQVTRVSVPLARLPKELHGFTLAQISDLHISSTIGADYVENVVQQVNGLQPQAIVITGDLVDGTVTQLGEVANLLARLKAPHGVFFVTGNHEYYSGVDKWLQLLPQLGIRPLRNERVSIGNGAASFDLAGIDDLSGASYGNGHGANIDAAVEGRDPQRELILLAHQPKAIGMAAAAGVGLMLSGHTHAGQVWPLGYFVRLVQPYVQGLALHDETYIYVNRGTGYVGPPMRLDATPEITLVELQSKAT